MSPCQPIASLGRPSEGGPDRLARRRALFSRAPRRLRLPGRRRRRADLPAPGCPPRPVRPLRRGTGRHCPPACQARAGPGKALAVTCTCSEQPEGPLSFTVPSCGAAQGRLPERPKGAVCKTVGFAFPGSNPGPATTSGNAPWLERILRSFRPSAPARSCPTGSSGVPLLAAAHGHIADRIRDHEARSAAQPWGAVLGPTAFDAVRPLYRSRTRRVLSDVRVRGAAYAVL